MLRCGSTLRPRQGAAGQRSPPPGCLPHLRRQDELIQSQSGKRCLSEPGLGWESGFPPSRPQGAQAEGQQGPHSVSKSLEPGHGHGPAEGHNNIPRAEAINGNVFLEGQMMRGRGIRSDPSSDKNTSGI